MERGGGGGGGGGEWREISANCPRCGSSNTKFCYYNNYSLTQPRYFCKGCRRYWTRGGSLRNVPVGGGCRKSRRGNNTRPFRSLTPPPSSSDGGPSFASYRTGLANFVSPPNLSVGSNIDLAVVYAKFLNQKTQNNDDNDDDHRSSVAAGGVEVVSDQLHTTKIDPMESLEGVNAATGMVCSDGLSNNSMCCLSSSSIGYGAFDDIGFGVQLSRGEDLEMPMQSSTTPSDWPFDSHSVSISIPQLRNAVDSETEAQFSNLCVGSWSPLDLSSYEPSSPRPSAGV